MRHIKTFKIFDAFLSYGVVVENYDAIINLLKDHQSEFSDLSIDMKIHGDKRNNYTVQYINGIDFIICIHFGLHSQDGFSFFTLSDCKEVLYSLHSRIESEFGLVMSVVNPNHRAYILDLDEMMEIYGPEDYLDLTFIIHEEIDKELLK